MMNAAECKLLRRLIAELDDARLVYATLAPLLIRPHLKFLVERMANSHAAIANHLALQMDHAGGPTARRGATAWARFRVRVERWIAIGNIDVELGCLECVARHLAGVIQRLRAALGNVRDLHENLHRELSQLERMQFRIESLMHEMEMPLPASPRQRAAVLPLSTHGRPRS
jgi:hypothetical protein